MTIEKYPIEIELTNFCGLKCRYCINKDLTNKGYLSDKDYDSFLTYVHNNIDNILYINIAGIGDIFLHPKINIFLIKFIKKFKNKNIDVLLSTKGLTVNKSILKILREFRYNKINLNISVGLFSFNPNKHDDFTQIKGSFGKTLQAIMLFKKENLKFSLEMLVSHYSIDSLNQFKLFGKKIGIDTILHKPHNFGGRVLLDTQPLIQDGLKDFCDFSGKEDNKGLYYRTFSNCNFIPFIDIDGYFNLCSLSAHSGKKLLYNLHNVGETFDNYIALVENFKGRIQTECNGCSLK